MKLVLGTSARLLARDLLVGVLFAAWSVFVNVVNLWLLTPLMTDLAVLGILTVLVIAAVWLFSVPRVYRRTFLVMTLFALLLGQGLSGLIQVRPAPPMLLGIIALAVLASWIGRFTLLTAILAAAALTLLNWQLPLRDWAYLAHMRIVSDTANPLDARGFSITPLFLVQTGQTQRVVTLQSMSQSAAPSFINRTYRYIEVSSQHGKVRTTIAHPDTLSHLPLAEVSLIASPLVQPAWHVKDGQVTVSFASNWNTQDYAAMTPAFTTVTAALGETWSSVLAADEQLWRQTLSEARVRPEMSGIEIHNGVLQGTVAGQAMHVPVQGTIIVAEGAFSQPHSHQVLLEGPGLLQVVALDKRPHVVSTYRPADRQLLAGTLFAGPIDPSGQDAVFINSNGTASAVAHIVGITNDKSWHVIYTAPNGTLRFLAAVQKRPGAAPEILTNDSSLLRPTAAAYLTSYAYKDDTLVQNWRLGVDGVSNAAAATLSAGKSPYIVLAAGQRLIVTQFQTFPAVPAAAGLLAALMAAGYIWQFARRRTYGE